MTDTSPPSSSSSSYVHLSDSARSSPSLAPPTPSAGPSRAGPSLAPSTPEHNVSEDAKRAGAIDLLQTKVSCQGRYLVDQDSRILLLRGVSISGMSKLPSSPDGRTHLSSGFFSHRDVSFLDRPFPLSEADEHFARLKRWGLTLVRLVVCWEGLEHRGPGEYDEEYLDYLVQLVTKAGKHGMKVIVDAHQDVWSRLTGGSGAPGWTLDLVGLELKNFMATGAAALHQLGSPLGAWPSGYQKLAAATMFTVFFAGNAFAPKRKVRRGLHRQWTTDPERLVSLQDFLQDSLAEAFGQLADRLKDIGCVIGFEPMNEPHRGYIELHSPTTWDYNTDLFIDRVPSFLQSLALGSGHAQTIDVYKPSWPFPSTLSHRELVSPPAGMRAWKDDVECLWAEHGVWKWDEGKKQPVVLKAGYFSRDPRTGKAFDFYSDAYFPFVRRFAERMHKSNSDWLIPVGPIPNEFYPQWPATDQPHNLVSGPHFYDLHSLFTKSHGNMTVNVQGLSRGMPIWNALYFGRQGAKDNYELQISRIVESTYEGSGGRPCIIGEAGICLDVHGGEAFRTGDFKWQTRQMDALMHALEASLASFVLWNYNPLNTPEHGDSWNGENFSIFSPATHQILAGEAKTDDAEGGSLVHDALLRPYACKVAGVPISTSFDMHTLTFRLRVRLSAASKSHTTEIFLPSTRYPKDTTKIVVSSGRAEYRPDLQTLFWEHEEGQHDTVTRIQVTVLGRASARVDVFDARLLLVFVSLVLVVGISVSVQALSAARNT